MLLMANSGQEELAPGVNSSRDQKFFDIEAPQKLELGQNFFDQPPFRMIIASISLQTGISEENIKRLLNSAAHIGSRSINTEFTSQDISKMMQNPYDPYPRDIAQSHATPGEIGIYRNAIKLLGENLETYPYWHEYIVTQCTNENYRFNGIPIRRKSNLMPETYAKLASDRSYQEKRQVLLGLDEIFPQDLSSQLQVPPISQNKKPQTKYWRILQASELINPKSR